MLSGSAQAEAAYLFVPAWLRMVSLRRPLFEEYDVIRPSGPIGKRCATRRDYTRPGQFAGIAGHTFIVPES